MLSRMIRPGHPALSVTIRARSTVSSVSNSQRRSLTTSSSSSSGHPNNDMKKKIMSPLPPSPSKAKQEYLKQVQTKQPHHPNHDPIQHMQELQKELDIVRMRAAERLEAKLQKSTWRRLTDPLKRHSHSWINVGSVLLAYILAHNLYMSAKEKRRLAEELSESQEVVKQQQGAMKRLLEEVGLKSLSNECWQAIQEEEDSSSSSSTLSWWSKTSSNSHLKVDSQQQQQAVSRLQEVLKKVLKEEFGDFLLTDEERRVQELQTAWKESNPPPEQELLQIMGGEEAIREALTSQSSSSSSSSSPPIERSTTSDGKPAKRVFSM